MKRICVAALCAAISSAALGGEVLFKNGDRLTGKVKSEADGKLVIESPIAGTVTVPMSSVKTFTTDEPVEIRMKDGAVVKQAVVAGTAEGTVETQAAGEAAKRTVPLADVMVINPDFGKWHGDFKAGLVVTAGNSRTQTANFGADATRRDEKDRITLKAEYLFARQTDVTTGVTTTTTDSWDGLGKYDYFFTKKFYAYGLMQAEHDRVADLNIRLEPGAGVGYQWHESPTWNFNTEIGAGFTYEDYGHGGQREYVSARAAYHYDRKLADKLKFFNDLEYLPDVEDFSKYNVNGDIGLHTDFTKKLFGEIKMEWKYNSEPAPNREKNDFRYVLSAGYQF